MVETIGYLSRGYVCSREGCNNPWNETHEESCDGGDTWEKRCQEHCECNWSAT